MGPTQLVPVLHVPPLTSAEASSSASSASDGPEYGPLELRMMQWGLVSSMVPAYELSSSSVSSGGAESSSTGIGGGAEGNSASDCATGYAPEFAQHNVRSSNPLVRRAFGPPRVPVSLPSEITHSTDASALSGSATAAPPGPPSATTVGGILRLPVSRCIIVLSGFYEWADPDPALYKDHHPSSEASGVPATAAETSFPAAPLPMEPFGARKEPYFVQLAPRFAQDPTDPSLFPEPPSSVSHQERPTEDEDGTATTTTTPPTTTAATTVTAGTAAEQWAEAAQVGLQGPQMRAYARALRPLTQPVPAAGCDSALSRSSLSTESVVHAGEEATAATAAAAAAAARASEDEDVEEDNDSEGDWDGLPPPSLTAPYPSTPPAPESVSAVLGGLPPSQPPSAWARAARTACPLFIAAICAAVPLPAQGPENPSAAGKCIISPASSAAVYTVGMVTKEASAQLSWLHHREPCVLTPAQAATWLNPKATHKELAAVVAAAGTGGGVEAAARAAKAASYGSQSLRKTKASLKGTRTVGANEPRWSSDGTAVSSDSSGHEPDCEPDCERDCDPDDTPWLPSYRCARVSALINNIRSRGQDCLEPLAVVQARKMKEGIGRFFTPTPAPATAAATTTTAATAGKELLQQSQDRQIGQVKRPLSPESAGLSSPGPMATSRDNGDSKTGQSKLPRPPYPSVLSQSIVSQSQASRSPVSQSRVSQSQVTRSPISRSPAAASANKRPLPRTPQQHQQHQHQHQYQRQHQRASLPSFASRLAQSPGGGRATAAVAAMFGVSAADIALKGALGGVSGATRRMKKEEEKEKSVVDLDSDTDA